MTPTATKSPATDAPVRLFDVKGMGGAPANASRVSVTGVKTEPALVTDAGQKIPKGAIVELRVFATVIGVGHDDQFETVDGSRHRVGTTRVHRCKNDSVELIGWEAPDEGEKGLKFDGEHLHPFHGGAPEKAPKASQRPKLEQAKTQQDIDEGPTQPEAIEGQVGIGDFDPVEEPTPEAPPVGQPFIDTSTQTTIGDTEEQLAGYLRGLDESDLREIAELNSIAAESPETDVTELVALGHSIDWGVVEPTAADEAAMVKKDEAEPDPVKVEAAILGQRDTYTPEALGKLTKPDLAAILRELTGETFASTAMNKKAFLAAIGSALTQIDEADTAAPAEGESSGLDF